MVTLFASFGQTNYQKAACRQLCLQIVPPKKVAADAREKDLILILDFFFLFRVDGLRCLLWVVIRMPQSKGSGFHTTLFPVLPRTSML